MRTLEVQAFTRHVLSARYKSGVSPAGVRFVVDSPESSSWQVLEAAQDSANPSRWFAVLPELPSVGTYHFSAYSYTASGITGRASGAFYAKSPGVASPSATP